MRLLATLVLLLFALPASAQRFDYTGDCSPANGLCQPGDTFDSANQNAIRDAINATPPPNYAIDTDGDAAPDFVIVRGDYDGNGQVQTDDIQAALDDLTDTGGKYLYVESGQFLAPTSGLTPATSGDKLGYDGLLSVPSNTTVECSAWGRAVIYGLDFDLGQDLSFSVFTGDNAGGGGNSEIHLRGCEIDGGLPDTYDSTGVANSTRMGVRMHNCDDCSFVGNYFHDNFHSSVYLREVNRNLVADNRMEDGGGYNDTAAAPAQGQPRIYFFIPNAGDAVESVDNVVRDNVMIRVPQGITTRVGGDLSPANARHRNLTVTGNVVIDALSLGSSFAGYEDVVYQSNALYSTGGIGTGTGTSLTHRDAGLRLRLLGNSIRNSKLSGSSAIGITLNDWNVDAVIADNVVDGTEGPCMSVSTTAFNANLSGTFRDCGTDGIALLDSLAVPNGIVLHDFVIDGWNQADPTGGGARALHLFYGCDGQIIRDGIVKGSGSWDQVIRTAGSRPFKDCTLENLVLDQAPANWVGTDVWANAPFNGTTSCSGYVEGDWGIITDAAGTGTVGGGGTTRNVVRCQGNLWTDWLFNGTASVFVGYQAGNVGNVFRNIVIRNTSGSQTGADRDAFQMENGAWEDTTFDGLHCESGGALVGLEGGTNCLESTGATATIRSTTRVTCGRNWSASTGGGWTSNGGVCDALP